MDLTARLSALHTLISREIVPGEARRAGFRTTATSALRASGWARGAGSCFLICCLTISTSLALSTTFRRTDLTARLSTRLVAPAVEKEVSTCTLSTSAITHCRAELGPHGISSAVAVQRGLAGIAAPRAVLRAPDDSPTGLTATRVSPALVHAGSIAWVSLIGVLEGLPRGAAQALVGPRCGARGALGAARLADVVIGIVAPELVALIDALAGGGEVVIRDARCANLAGCLRVITCLAVGVLQVC